MVRRHLQSALHLLNLQYYQQAVQEIIFLFTELDIEVDVLSLLDRMLAIGNTEPLEVTDEVAARIATLANRDSPVTRREGYPVLTVCKLQTSKYYEGLLLTYSSRHCEYSAKD